MKAALGRQIRVARILANFRLDDVCRCASSRRHKKLLPIAKLEVYETKGHQIDAAIMQAGLRVQHGLAMADSYRDILHWKIQYNDGATPDGDLQIVKGEVSSAEASVIDSEGKAQRNLWCYAGGHPPGVFPLNSTGTEAHSPALY